MAFKEKLQIVQATAGAKTLTTEHVKAGATVIKVESTAGFPPAGEAYLVTSQAFSYTGINGTTELTGVTGVVNTFSINVSVTAPYETLLNLNDAAHFFIKSGSFKVVAPVTTRVLAQDQRRWGGAREVGAVSENGSVNWEVAVAGTTAQEAIEKVETLLAQLESNPTQLLLLWQPGEVTNPTLYEIRGAGHWEPNFENATLEGANLFMIALEIPVGPLAQGLPGVVYEKSGLTLPETITLSSIPGDAPALAEVAIQPGTAQEESWVTGVGTIEAIAVDANYVYFAHGEYIGRVKLDGTGLEATWIPTTGKPISIAVNSEYIWWGNSASGDIGRAPITGGSVAPAWLVAEGGSTVFAVCVDSGHIYWTRPEYIGRATLAGGSIETKWIKAKAPPGRGGLAVSSEYIYFPAEVALISSLCKHSVSGGLTQIVTNGEARDGLAIHGAYLYWGETGGIYRSLLSGAEAGPYLSTETTPRGVAANSEHLYYGLPTPSHIGRFSILVSSAPPIFALLGWCATPTSGLAPAPFGVLYSSAATAVSGWVYSTQAGAYGGSCLHASERKGAAYWEVDPATMVPDSFSGEIAVEVWARVLLSELLNDEEGFSNRPMLTLSARPQDGTGYGASRYTDEWGSAGRPIELPEEEERFRITRLGTVHMLVNPLAPRVWKLWVEGEAHEAAQWGLDYLILVPSMQRACSPSSKPANASYPQFISNVARTVKTIRSNLSATVAKPGKNGHPDHGLGGNLMEFPAGECSLLVKLSNLVPDAPDVFPEVSNASEQLAYEAKVTVTVTPRWFLARA
jgi:hypothetical protein